MSVIADIARVAFKRAAADEEVADDGGVAAGEGKLMQILLYGIA